MVYIVTRIIARTMDFENRWPHGIPRDQTEEVEVSKDPRSPLKLEALLLPSRLLVQNDL